MYSKEQGSVLIFFEVVKIECALYLGASIVLARIYHVCNVVEYVFNDIKYLMMA